jgi:hypothetical protein
MLGMLIWFFDDLSSSTNNYGWSGKLAWLKIVCMSTLYYLPSIPKASNNNDYLYVSMALNRLLNNRVWHRLLIAADARSWNRKQLFGLKNHLLFLEVWTLRILLFYKYWLFSLLDAALLKLRHFLVSFHLINEVIQLSYFIV